MKQETKGGHDLAPCTFTGYSVKVGHMTDDIINAAQCVRGMIDKRKRQIVMSEHDLYKTGDKGAPESIKDINGAVVLDLCKRCGEAEADLNAECCASSRYRA